MKKIISTLSICLLASTAIFAQTVKTADDLFNKYTKVEGVQYRLEEKPDNKALELIGESEISKIRTIKLDNVESGYKYQFINEQKKALKKLNKVISIRMFNVDHDFMTCNLMHEKNGNISQLIFYTAIPLQVIIIDGQLNDVDMTNIIKNYNKAISVANETEKTVTPDEAKKVKLDKKYADLPAYNLGNLSMFSSSAPADPKQMKTMSDFINYAEQVHGSTIIKMSKDVFAILPTSVNQPPAGIENFGIYVTSTIDEEINEKLSNYFEEIRPNYETIDIDPKFNMPGVTIARKSDNQIVELIVFDKANSIFHIQGNINIDDIGTIKNTLISPLQ